MPVQQSIAEAKHIYRDVTDGNIGKLWDQRIAPTLAGLPGGVILGAPREAALAVNAIRNTDLGTTVASKPAIQALAEQAKQVTGPVVNPIARGIDAIMTPVSNKVDSVLDRISGKTTRIKELTDLGVSPAVAKTVVENASADSRSLLGTYRPSSDFPALINDIKQARLASKPEVLAEDIKRTREALDIVAAPRNALEAKQSEILVLKHGRSADPEKGVEAVKSIAELRSEILQAKRVKQASIDRKDRKGAFDADKLIKKHERELKVRNRLINNAEGQEKNMLNQLAEGSKHQDRLSDVKAENLSNRLEMLERLQNNPVYPQYR
jgi:hypothetical protein